MNDQKRLEEILQAEDSIKQMAGEVTRLRDMADRLTKASVQLSRAKQEITQSNSALIDATSKSEASRKRLTDVATAIQAELAEVVSRLDQRDEQIQHSLADYASEQSRLARQQETVRKLLYYAIGLGGAALLASLVLLVVTIV